MIRDVLAMALAGSILTGFATGDGFDVVAYLARFF